MNESDPVNRQQPSAAGFWSERGLSDLALLALTVLALLLCYLIARPFITSLAWATALAVIGWPLHRWIVRRIHWPTAAASLSVTILSLLLIVPSGMVIPSMIDEALSGYRLLRTQIESNVWDEALSQHVWIAPAWEWLRQRLDLGDLLQRAGLVLTAIGSFTVKSSFVGTIKFVLTFFFLFYFLRDRDELLASVRSLLPLSQTETERVFRVVSDTIFATMYGKVLAGIVQGALGGLMFWWLDLPAVWFWAIVMGLLSIIPLLGPPIIWAPAALLLLLNGEWGHALLLVVWGAAVVGLADNLLYPIIVGKYLRLHTVPLLIALIGGVVVFGVVGFFVGPVVLALTMVAFEIWRARAGSSST
ncbi:AI-2E family transporter [Pectobacteriaceae bacterium C52]|nr:AI-2E family transporter [Pectobacteriaceae bacterium C52]